LHFGLLDSIKIKQFRPPIKKEDSKLYKEELKRVKTNLADGARHCELSHC